MLPVTPPYAQARFYVACILLALSAPLYSQCGPTPIVYNGLALSLPFSGSVTVNASVFDAGSIDGCASGGLTFSFSSDPNDDTRTFDCNDDPSTLLEIWVTDQNNNKNVVETYILLQNFPAQCPPTTGGCGPAAIAYNGLTVDISAGPVEIPAEWFDAGSLDLCNTDELYYEVAFVGSNLYGPTLLVDCSLDFAVLVNLKVTDAAGNISIVETYILVEDQQDFCGGNSPISPCGPAPVLMNGLAVGLPPSGVADLPVSAVFLDYVDGCNAGNIQTTIAEFGNLPNFGVSSLPNTCADIGTKLINGFIQDNAGNTVGASTFILVQDNLPPIVVCSSGISAELPSSGLLTLNAEAFIDIYQENCPGIRFSFSPDPDDNSRTFSCLDIGTIPLTIWFTDNNGYQASCTSEVTIVDNSPSCIVCTGFEYNLSGTIGPDYFRSEDYINASGVINEFAILQATNSVRLLPGFTAPNGTTLNALIEPCLPPAPIVETPPESTPVHRTMEVQVFPNPFRNQSTVQVRLSDRGKLRIFVTDYTGKILSVLADFDFFQDDFWEGELRTGLPAGIYFLHVESDSKREIRKIIRSY